MGHQLLLSRCPYCCVLSRLRRTGCRRPTCTYVPIGIEPLLVNRSALPGFLVSSRQSRPAPRAAWPPSDLLPGAAPACPGSFELDQGLVHRGALLRENGPALELIHRCIFTTARRPIVNGFFVLAGLWLWSPFPSLAPQVAVARVSRRRLHLKTPCFFYKIVTAGRAKQVSLCQPPRTCLLRKTRPLYLQQVPGQ